MKYHKGVDITITWTPTISCPECGSVDNQRQGDPRDDMQIMKCVRCQELYLVHRATLYHCYKITEPPVLDGDEKWKEK